MKLKTTIAVTLFLLLSLAVQAQNEFPSSPQLSKKHKQKLEKISDPEKKLRKYKKWFRQDSIKWEKKRRKLAKAKGDTSFINSIKTKFSEEINLSSIADILSLPDSDTSVLVNELADEYSAEAAALIKADSSSINILKDKANEELINELGESDALGEYSDDITTFDITTLLKADSTTIDLAKEKAGEEIINGLQESEVLGEYSKDIPSLLKADSSSVDFIKNKATEELVNETDALGEYGGDVAGLLKRDSLSGDLIVSKAREELINQIDTDVAIDTAQLSQMFESDSAFVASSFKIFKDSLSSSEEFGEYGKYLDDAQQLKDSASLDYVGKRLEEEVVREASEMDEISALQEHQNGMGGLEELQQSPDELLASEMPVDNPQDAVKNLANEELVRNIEAVTAAQGEMQKLKKKYSSVLNSNDLSTAVKRSSLEDKNLLQRLIFNGNFQVQSYKPITLDASPTLGYRINKLFHLGAGFHWRYTFKDSVNLNIPESNIGYKAYVSHDVFRNFFGYSEYENQRMKQENSFTDKQQYDWQEAWHIGLGRIISINNLLDAQVLVLYNLLHNPMDPLYPSPWNIRVGVQVKSERLLKKK